MEVATTLLSLASLELERHHHIDAEPLAREALMTLLAAGARDVVEVASARRVLASSLRFQQRLEETDELSRLAVEGLDEAAGPDHEQTLLALEVRAAVVAALGEHRSAEAIYLELLERLRRLLGADHPHVARVLNNLGYSYRRDGRLAEAERCYRESLAIQEQIVGPHNPNTIRLLLDIASVRISWVSTTPARCGFSTARRVAAWLGSATSGGTRASPSAPAYSAGAVQIILGGAAGLAPDGAQLWYQGKLGIEQVPEDRDAFGEALASGDFDGDGFADLAIGIPSEGVSTADQGGASQLLYGGPSGLSSARLWFLSQNTAGMAARRRPATASVGPCACCTTGWTCCGGMASRPATPGLGL